MTQSQGLPFGKWPRNMKKNMKMHNVTVGLIAGIIVMLSAAACGETELDPDLFGSSELSEIIRDDFYGRYSGGINESFWWYDVDYCIEYVDSNYPEATILGAINDSGGNVLFINDRGVRQSVRFRQDSYDQIWYETVWQLDDDTVLPENVAREYAEYREENPDFAYTSVFYVERKDGEYYGLEMETGRLTSQTVFLKI